MRSISRLPGQGPRLRLRWRRSCIGNRAGRAATSQSGRDLADELIRRAATSACRPRRGRGFAPRSVRRPDSSRQSLPVDCNGPRQRERVRKWRGRSLLCSLPPQVLATEMGLRYSYCYCGAGQFPEETPRWGISYLGAPETGTLRLASRPLLRPHYRRANLTLRRAHVTQNRKSLWKTQKES